jgi:hypothetical protein
MRLNHSLRTCSRLAADAFHLDVAQGMSDRLSRSGGPMGVSRSGVGIEDEHAVCATTGRRRRP